MSKRFFELSNAEMLALDNEALNTAIRIEAIERGIQTPITLSEQLRSSEWIGYQKPAEAIQVWEIHVKSRYNYEQTGVAYRTKEDAEKAMEGIMTIERGYSNEPAKLKVEEPRLVCVNISVAKSSQKAVAFEAFTQDTEAFDKVVDECVEHLRRLRQREYNTKVRAEKKTEYLRLAAGNEQVARNFWAKVEASAWDDDQATEEPVLSPKPDPVPVPSIVDDIFN